MFQGWVKFCTWYLIQNLEYLVLTCTWHFEILKYLVLVLEGKVLDTCPTAFKSLCHINTRLCNLLVKLHEPLVRIITCSKYNAHTDPLFKSIEILKVAKIFNLNALKFYYKYLHGKLPSHTFIASISWRKDHNTHPTHVKVNKLELSAHEPNIVTTD